MQPYIELAVFLAKTASLPRLKKHSHNESMFQGLVKSHVKSILKVLCTLHNVVEVIVKVQVLDISTKEKNYLRVFLIFLFRFNYHTICLFRAIYQVHKKCLMRWVIHLQFYHWTQSQRRHCHYHQIRIEKQNLHQTGQERHQDAQYRITHHHFVWGCQICQSGLGHAVHESVWYVYIEIVKRNPLIADDDMTIVRQYSDYDL